MSMIPLRGKSKWRLEISVIYVAGGYGPYGGGYGPYGGGCGGPYGGGYGSCGNRWYETLSDENANGCSIM